MFYFKSPRSPIECKSKFSGKKILTIILSGLLICHMAASPAEAASIAILAYEPVNGESAPPTVQGADITGSNLTRGGGLSASTGNTFNTKGWQESSLEDAIAVDDCLYWGFSSSTAYDLSSLSIRYDRSETGPSTIVIQLDVGSGFSTIFMDSEISIDSEENTGIDLSDYSDITTADFRLCGFGASSTLGTFDIEATSSFDGNNGLVLFAEEAITPITLATFDVYPKSDTTLIEWTTAAEIDNAGYNIYGGPSIDGPWIRLNASMIAATGSPTESANYSAMFASNAVYYLLEDVNYSGEATRHPPLHINGNMSNNPDYPPGHHASGFVQKIFVPFFQ